MKITTIGIDLAKTVFQVHGVDERGKTVLRKQLKRKVHSIINRHFWERSAYASKSMLRAMSPLRLLPPSNGQRRAEKRSLKLALSIPSLPLSFMLPTAAMPRLRSLRQCRSTGANGQLRTSDHASQAARKRTPAPARRSNGRGVPHPRILMPAAVTTASPPAMRCSLRRISCWRHARCPR